MGSPEIGTLPDILVAQRTIKIKNPIQHTPTTLQAAMIPRKRVFCGPYTVKNTWGSQLVDQIMDQVVTNHIKIVDKGFLTDREYYSAFHDIWNFHKTDMNKYLEKHHTDEVYIVGVALEYCVKATAISAAEL